MERKSMRVTSMLLAASMLVAPDLACAQSAPATNELEARLARLESELAALRAELTAARGEQAQTAAIAQQAVAQSEAAVAKAATPAPAPVPADGFRAGATTIRLGGFIKTVASNSRFSDGEVATNALGRDFYLPQAIPAGGGRASRVQDFSAKQSRFWLNLSTDVAGHALKAYVETDFQTSPGTQGSQRTTNGYNLALRRAYVQLDKFTFGQDWTTFQYTGALPESTDFVGATEGTVFVRQPLVRYSMPVGEGLTLHAAIENAESGTATQGNPALVENGDDSLPDFAARLAYSGKLGELSLAGLARQLRVDNGGVDAKRFGWGLSAAGKIFLAADKSSDVRFMATYGQGAGRYVGLNFAPDAVFMPAGNRLGEVGVFAALAAARIGVAPDVRLNLIGSYQRVDYDDRLPVAGLAGFNKSAWSGAANVFWSPVKNVDVGFEYRHGERELVSGAQGQLDRFEFAAKYGF